MTTRTLTPRRQKQFLDALSESGNVSAAARVSKVRRGTAYVWRRDDPEFARAWDAALELGVEALEDEARRRAMEGSDLLMIFLLKAHKPGRYNRSPLPLPPEPGKSAAELARDIVATVRAMREIELGGDGAMLIESDPPAVLTHDEGA